MKVFVLSICLFLLFAPWIMDNNVLAHNDGEDGNDADDEGDAEDKSKAVEEEDEENDEDVLGLEQHFTHNIDELPDSETSWAKAYGSTTIIVPVSDTEKEESEEEKDKDEDDEDKSDGH